MHLILLKIRFSSKSWGKFLTTPGTNSSSPPPPKKKTTCLLFNIPDSCYLWRPFCPVHPRLFLSASCLVIVLASSVATLYHCMPNDKEEHRWELGYLSDTGKRHKYLVSGRWSYLAHTCFSIQPRCIHRAECLYEVNEQEIQWGAHFDCSMMIVSVWIWSMHDLHSRKPDSPRSSLSLKVSLSALI